MIPGALALAAALALATPALAADAPAPVDHSVRAPQHGDVLFHFFQDHTFDALSSLMVSQHFERLGVHADEAELLRGGLMLSYGMHREAGEVFAHLIERGTEPALRDRAWYYLAKVRYARGLLPEAAQALAQLSGELPGEQEDARRLLQAQVSLGLGDAAAAARALQPLAEAAPRPAPPPAPSAERRGLFTRLSELVRRPWFGPDPLAATDADARLFARYNLGVALLRQGDTEAGRQWLERLGTTPAANEEQRLLRDRANLALGFGALQAQQPEAARTALERIRLHGPVSNKALLGFGWAAMALKQPRQALVPWRELASRDDSDAAVLEARLAVPHALAELGADPEALAGYQQALSHYDAAGQALAQASRQLQDGAWLAELLQRNPHPGFDWSAQLAELPALPQQVQIAPLLAANEFQEGYKTWRDLRELQALLRDWQDKLGSYQDMLAQRRARFDSTRPAVQARADRIDLGPLRQRQQALSSELAQAEQAADGQAFADARQQGLAERLRRSQAVVASTEHGLDEAARRQATERLRLAAGALQWELAQAFPERDWQAQKALRASAGALAQAEAAQAALTQAQRDEAARLAQFDQRIATLAQRVAALLPPLAATEAAQAQALQQQLVDSLGEQQQRLAHYRTQAQFAIAQLHDRARAPQTESPDAPR